MSVEETKAQDVANNVAAASPGPDASAEAEATKYRNINKRLRAELDEAKSIISEFQSRTGLDIAEAADQISSKQTESEKAIRELKRLQSEHQKALDLNKALSERERGREIKALKQKLLTGAGIRTDRLAQAEILIGDLVSFDEEQGQAALVSLDEEQAIKSIRESYPEWLTPTGHNGTGLPSQTKSMRTPGAPDYDMSTSDLIQSGLEELIKAGQIKPI